MDWWPKGLALMMMETGKTLMAHRNCYCVVTVERELRALGRWCPSEIGHIYKRSDASGEGRRVRMKYAKGACPSRIL